MHGGGLTPNFYRFKLCPWEGKTLRKVFEVEEYMGNCFLEELAAELYENSKL